MAKRKPLITRNDERTQVAVLLATKGLARFRWSADWTRTVWDRRGRYVVNPLRQIPQSVYRSMEKLSDVVGGDDYTTMYDVDPSKLWSFQSTLVRRDLIRYIKNFREVSRRPSNCHYPFAYEFNGKMVLWNGNHRTVAAFLRGERLPRLNVCRLRGALRRARAIRDAT